MRGSCATGACWCAACVDRDAALRFADQIDRSFAEREQLAAGEPAAEGYYEEFGRTAPFEIADGARSG